MAHMQFDTALDDLVRLDGPIQKGPVPRWQRKENTPAVRSSSQSNPPKTPSFTCTPRRRAMLKSLGRTPGKSPMSAKTTIGGGRTPGKKTPQQNRKPLSKKTEASNPQLVGDRFIPNRALMDHDISNHLLTKDEEEDDDMDKYRAAIKERLNPDKDAKILSFKQKAPKPIEGHSNNLKVLYSSSKTAPNNGKCYRFIPTVADRILDAPYLRDDFYLTLLDWGPRVAVALNNEIYLWDAQTRTIEILMELEGEDNYITCVSWIEIGHVLAVGLSDGTVQLWDVEEKKNLRDMTGHAARVGALAWNEYVLSSGSRSGKIHHHDVRVQNHLVATLDSHTQEVCGLKWSPDGRYLASGGNDNAVNIWEYNSTTPVFNLTQHQAAVKALAWCPWQPSVLASGGGTADRMIHFWNASTGNSINRVDTESQVSSILWSEEHKEVITSHGYAQNQLTIWKYPTMTKLCHLKGHTSRVLSMCLSPDKTTVLSCAGDETIRLWKCFTSKTVMKAKKVARKTSTSISGSLSSMQIR